MRRHVNDTLDANIVSLEYDGTEGSYSPLRKTVHPKEDNVVSKQTSTSKRAWPVLARPIGLARLLAPDVAMTRALLLLTRCLPKTPASCLRSSRPYSSGPTTTPFYRRPLVLTSFLSISLASYTLGSLYPPPQLTLLFPRPAPGPPSSPDSPSSVAYITALEQTLQTLPLLQSLRSKPDAEEWYEARPYTNYPEERRVNNLSAGTLRGPGKLALRPLVRAKKDETGSILFVHVGRGLCGHDGIIHGGLLATLLDESLARTVRWFGFFSSTDNMYGKVMTGDKQFSRTSRRYRQTRRQLHSANAGRPGSSHLIISSRIWHGTPLTTPLSHPVPRY
jgi:hypothetical protein